MANHNLCLTFCDAPSSLSPPPPPPPSLTPLVSCWAVTCPVSQGLMAPSQLIAGQLGDAMDYMEEVDQSLQV